MAWNVLPTLADGNTPNAAQLNLFSQNLAFLRVPVVNGYVETGGNITTTSTTFADISANFSKTFTMSGGHALVLFSCVCGNAVFDYNVDGTRRGDAAAGSLQWRDGTNAVMILMPLLLTGLSAGSHTISVQWRVPVAGTATLYTTYLPRFYVVQKRGG